MWVWNERKRTLWRRWGKYHHGGGGDAREKSKLERLRDPEIHSWAFTQMKQNLKSYLHHHVHCNITHNSQDTETTSVSTEGWMEVMAL